MNGQSGKLNKLVALKSLRPLDRQTIAEILSQFEYVFTIENHVLKGGVGQQILSEFREALDGKYVENIAFPEQTIEHGSIAEVERAYGIDAESIAAKIRKAFKTRTNNVRLKA